MLNGALPHEAAKQEGDHRTPFHSHVRRFKLQALENPGLTSKHLRSAAGRQSRGRVHETTVDHALIRGLGPQDLCSSRSCLCLAASIGRCPADSGCEGSPDLTAPPALPDGRMLNVRWRLRFLTMVMAGYRAVTGTRWAIAQMKPASSRAIAVVTTLAGLPLWASRR